MAVPRLKCLNKKRKITMLIFIPFTDQSVDMDKSARKLFDKYVERNTNSFFMNVLGHCFCENGVVLLAEFACPSEVSLCEIKKRLSTWKHYAPWNKKSIEDYIEENAFNSSFIIGNMSLCFSKNLNLYKSRERKLSDVFISTILEDQIGVYKLIIKEKILEPIQKLLSKLGINVNVNKKMDLSKIRKRFMRIGLLPSLKMNPVEQAKELIAFMLNFTRKKLNHNNVKNIRKLLSDLNNATIQVLQTRYIGTSKQLIRDYGCLKVFFIDSYPNIVSLRQLII